MGKHSRKIKKSQQGRQAEIKTQETKQMSAEIKALLDEENYTEVLNKLADMIKAKCYDAMTMYAGAYSYFMIGDYERASNWVNNTLSYDANNVSARILLAQLCFTEDRVTDGLAICDFVMANYSAKLDDEQLREVTDLSIMYIYDDDIDTHDYPHLEKLLNIADDSASETVAAPATEPVDQAAVVESANPVEAKTDVANEASESDVAALAAAKAQEILQQNISLTAKIKLLNSFAASFYLAKDYVAAASLLTEALKIDTADDATLRNMVMTQLALGDTEKAQLLLAKMSTPDFVLLAQF